MVVDIFIGEKEFKNMYKSNSSNIRDCFKSKTHKAVNGVFGLVFIGVVILTWQQYLDWFSVLVTVMFFVLLKITKMIVDYRHIEKIIIDLFDKQDENERNHQLIIESDKIRKKMKTYDVVYKKKHFNQVVTTGKFIQIKSPGMTDLYIPKYQVKSPEKLVMKLQEFIGVKETK